MDLPAGIVSKGAGRLAFELHGWPLLNRRDNPTTAWMKSETKRRETTRDGRELLNGTKPGMTPGPRRERWGSGDARVSTSGGGIPDAPSLELGYLVAMITVLIILGFLATLELYRGALWPSLAYAAIGALGGQDALAM